MSNKCALRYYPLISLRNKRLFILGLLIWVFGTGVLFPASAVPFPYGEPEYSATVVGNATLYPGNISLLTLSILNTAHTPEKILDMTDPVISSPLVGMGVELTLKAGSSPIDVIGTPLTIPILPPSVPVTVSFPVIVPADAKSGKYRLPLQVTSWYADSVAMEGTGTNVFHYQPKNVTLEVPIRIKPVVRAEVTDLIVTNISPGHHGRISATITNIGNYAGKNAIAELISDKNSPLIPNPGSYYLGTIKPGEKRSVFWGTYVSDTIESAHIPVTLVITYEDEDGIFASSEPLQIGIPISAGPKFSVSYEKPVIEPGGRAAVKVVYTNTGDAPAYDATAKIVPISPVSSPVTSAAFGTLNPGDSAEVMYEFILDQSALVKTYGVLTDVKYRGENGLVALSDPMRIEIDGAPHGILSYLLSPISLIILLGVILILGYGILKKEGRLV
ncbi:MAG TPA: hypothetical protein PK024_04040 [Methanospirillum sp.]|uniref:COG1361 S-layer family protein n=1 Tax=Methanospirillum sp. TaxID=45200 RepID=UPI002B8A904F|nr:hypothetical protein [Methanospirillum sp.]HOJ95994.1 hypothetical protein [Methanospirillum sp.]